MPGCASGEEVYSIAIALVEYLGDRHSAVGIQIFGTDVSEAAIEKARAGIYLASIAQDVSEERLERFFVKQDDGYQIAKSLRDLCVFARQDVTRDPPFSRLDLVSCRNLLIYLDAAAQRRVMQIFHYALRPHGYLMLGPSESVGQASDLFELSDKSHRLYARRASLPGTGPGIVQRGTSGLRAAGRDQRAADGNPRGRRTPQSARPIACCSRALRRRACWSTTRSTSCSSAVRPDRTSSMPAARRA